MEKWARRQDKIKMSFKQQQIPTNSLTTEKSIVSIVATKTAVQNVQESSEPIKVDFFKAFIFWLFDV